MDAVARVPSVVPGAPLGVAPSTGRRLRILLTILAVALAGGVLSGLVWVHRFATSIDAPAPVLPPTPLAALSDLRTVAITITTPDWT
ncbi:MAG: hypothetical protein M3468_11940, partial [Acidobacteriota bacterium]|nr:hypothetical protein [Acidobacteriota bacterium]